MSLNQYDDHDLSLFESRQERRVRKHQTNHKPKKSRQATLSEVADIRDVEAGLQITYQPALFEEGWLLSTLTPFFNLAFITDVTSRVKGGKEASVYRCVAHSSMGVEVLAAKVYRPRMFRNLRNDGMYREGRTLLDQDGRPIKATDQRVHRAVNKRSAFGEQIRHTSWLTYEYQMINRLYALGADVPKTYAVTDNAVLMTLVGDAYQSAPTLHEVALEHDEARYLFDRMLENIELMLRHNVVHGDLSAFNVLYWEGDITMIDFPQAVDPNVNRNARSLFERDVTRICEYFARQGVTRDSKALAKKLWHKYHDDIPPIDYGLENV